MNQAVSRIDNLLGLGSLPVGSTYLMLYCKPPVRVKYRKAMPLAATPEEWDGWRTQSNISQDSRGTRLAESSLEGFKVGATVRVKSPCPSAASSGLSKTVRISILLRSCNVRPLVRISASRAADYVKFCLAHKRTYRSSRFQNN